MQPSPSVFDQEIVYELLFREQWSELLDLIHGNPGAVVADALLVSAVETFAVVFLERLKNEGPEPYEAEVEKLFLLHAGGYHRLSNERFEQVVVHLVRLHEDRPATAAGYAKHCPSNPVCAKAIARYEVRDHANRSGSDVVSMTRTRPHEDADRTLPLLKSQQEVDFYLAAREVFTTYLVYPSVALRTVIDFEAIRQDLSSAERRFFFVGVLDCVVFDPHDGYRPLFFFELDSPLHDDAAQRLNDQHKDRIVSVAGARLYRIRTTGGRATRRELVRLLGSVAA